MISIRLPDALLIISFIFMVCLIIAVIRNRTRRCENCKWYYKEFWDGNDVCIKKNEPVIINTDPDDTCEKWEAMK